MGDILDEVMKMEKHGAKPEDREEYIEAIMEELAMMSDEKFGEFAVWYAGGDRLFDDIEESLRYNTMENVKAAFKKVIELKEKANDTKWKARARELETVMKEIEEMLEYERSKNEREFGKENMEMARDNYGTPEWRAGFEEGLFAAYDMVRRRLKRIGGGGDDKGD